MNAFEARLEHSIYVTEERIWGIHEKQHIFCDTFHEPLVTQRSSSQTLFGWKPFRLRHGIQKTPVSQRGFPDTQFPPFCRGNRSSEIVSRHHVSHIFLSSLSEIMEHISYQQYESSFTFIPYAERNTYHGGQAQNWYSSPDSVLWLLK